jgi:hypothetical protein
MTEEAEAWLDAAGRNLNIPIRKLPLESAASVYMEAQSRYVIGNPSAWWMDLSRPCAHYDSSTTSLSDVLPAREGQVFLIPESNAVPVVYEIEAAHLEAILADCPYFEYYIVDLNFRWLVAESEHNVFFVCHASHGDSEARSTRPKGH